MSLAAGCDVVDVARLSAALDRREGLLERLFTATELADARRDGVTPGSDVERARLAARFAAKEATRKALRDLRLPFHAVEVRSLPGGAPELWLRGERSELVCSLSHDAGVAMAVVVGFVAATATPVPRAVSTTPAVAAPQTASNTEPGRSTTEPGRPPDPDR